MKKHFLKDESNLDKWAETKSVSRFIFLLNNAEIFDWVINSDDM